ncbi:MAG: hypothetical protein CFK52_14940 [Chloracidobacterium sp. CP2_5A]|nr:MAG: hypothetical protein CFK52_14940 [Chloracidobacterium sp. CP2_5A]
MFLALSPKSDSAYLALKKVRAAVQETFAEPVPLHLRNAPTRLMKQLGYSAGYQHAHRFDDAVSGMDCLPDKLRGTVFYEPTTRGVEQRLRDRLREIRELRQKRREHPPEASGVGG